MNSTSLLRLNNANIYMKTKLNLATTVLYSSVVWWFSLINLWVEETKLLKNANINYELYMDIYKKFVIIVE